MSRFVNTTNTDNGSGTSVALPALSLTATNLIRVWVRWNNNVSCTSVTDTAGNTYTSAGELQWSGNIRRLQLWYCANATGNASNVVTANFSGSASLVYMRSTQWTGFGSTPFVSFTSAANGASLQHIINGSVTATAADQDVDIGLASDQSRTLANLWDEDTTDTQIPTIRGSSARLWVANAELNFNSVAHVYRALLDLGQSDLMGIAAALFTPTASDQPVRLSQEVLEVAETASDGDIRLSQAVIEVADEASAGGILLSQEVVEVAETGSDGDVILSQMVLEVAWDPTTFNIEGAHLASSQFFAGTVANADQPVTGAHLASSQFFGGTVALEQDVTGAHVASSQFFGGAIVVFVFGAHVASSQIFAGEVVPVVPGAFRATQVVAEVTETPGVSDTRFSQVVSEVGQDPNEIRVSHVVSEVGQDPNEIRVSQIVAEIAQGGDAVDVSSGDTRVTQVFLNILANREEFTFEEVTPCSDGGDVPDGTNPDPGPDIRDAEIPLVWVEFDVYNGPLATERAAKVAINDTEPRIPPRLLAVGHVTRAVSDSSGRMEGATAKVVLNDTDRYVRGLIDTGQIFGQPASVYIADRATIQASGVPRRLAHGFVKDYDFPDDFQVGLEIEDQMTYETSPLAGDRQMPEYLIPSDIVDENPPGDPEDITSWPAPLAYGRLSDEDEEEPEGVVPARYTMQSSMFADLGYSNIDFHLVCLGVVSGIQSAYVADTINGGDHPTERMRVPDEAWGDWIWAPYRPGWFLPDNWIEINGRRWTFILMRQDHPAAEHAREGRIPVTVNMCGYEDVGDGSGEMITALTKQWIHFLINFVFNQYEGVGDWQTAIPTMPGQTYSVIDTVAVEAVQAILDDRAGQEHEGAFLIGHSETRVDLDDILTQFNRNMGVDSFFNKHGQMTLGTLDTNGTFTSAKVLNQSRGIGKGWKPDPRPEEVENTIKYGYMRRYHKLLAETTEDQNLRVREPKDVKFKSGTVTLPSPTGIAAMNGRIKESRMQEYDMIRLLHLAHVLASFRLAWNRRPRFLVTVPLVDYYAADMELDEALSVTHEQGLTATGWTERLVQIKRLTIDTDNENSVLAVRDVQNLIGLVVAEDPEPGGEPAGEPTVPE